MLRPVTTVLLAFALGVLPVVRDVCGPECEMGDATALVAAAAAGDDIAADDGAECPLHPTKDDVGGRVLSDPPRAPVHQEDGCTHDHGTVREAPESPSALAPSVQQSLELPTALFSWTSPHTAADRPDHTVVSPPVDRAPRLLALRL